jgi:predicted ATPase
VPAAGRAIARVIRGQSSWSLVSSAPRPGRRRRVKSLELQAAVSLGRVWQQQGKKDTARQVLAEICKWFTEGFDTADLRGAKALLDALSCL